MRLLMSLEFVHVQAPHVVSNLIFIYIEGLYSHNPCPLVLDDQGFERCRKKDYYCKVRQKKIVEHFSIFHIVCHLFSLFKNGRYKFFILYSLDMYLAISLTSFNLNCALFFLIPSIHIQAVSIYSSQDTSPCAFSYNLVLIQPCWISCLPCLL